MLQWLEWEESKTVDHKCLKIIQDFNNNISKLLFIIDSLKSYLKKKELNMIRKDKKPVKLQKDNNHRKLPSIKANGLCGMSKKMI